MHMVIYYYIRRLYIHTYKHTFSLEKHYHADKREMVSRSHCALPVSSTLVRRWYHVNVVPTTLVLRQSGSYYVVNRCLPRSLAATLLLRAF